MNITEIEAGARVIVEHGATIEVCVVKRVKDNGKVLVSTTEKNILEVTPDQIKKKL